ncbi:haloacid dehalogenase [Candidatus Endobugula sertula]|uniref:Haloacid dehalogenase n=1 Tax=Candidatus Endobugula sertula TaxID=62101 RepID=A0A1D2QR59_9GAMM|nr:haloacid dehalogenase [Candidatus Endobugula sertula]
MVNWNKIDTVMLDMDGTLLDLHYDTYFWTNHLPQRYAELKQIPETEARHRLNTHIRSLKGTLNWYCLDYWATELDINILTLKREIKERPYTKEFLQFLQVQKKQVVLVTNAHPVGLNIKLGETCIGDYLDHIISSHQFSEPKEAQAFWHHLRNHFPFNSQRTLFIDDNLTILESAKAYGIAYILGIHQPDSQIERQLEGIPAIYHFNEIMPDKAID